MEGVAARSINGALNKGLTGVNMRSRTARIMRAPNTGGTIIVG